MLRWLMSLVSIAAFTMAFRATEPSTLGWSLLIGFVAMVIAFVGFAAARVASVAGGQHGREQSLLITSRSKVTPTRPATPAQRTEPPAPSGPA